MVELTIDGKAVEVPEGSMVMHAADELGIYIPHFCYHKKLSIAANCRMCLVEVEKAPKALPACATPVSNGMVVHTKSQRAIDAQKSVMEFLLINHPLDCPICDQGGECQLQDLAVGYGASGSRYREEKRVVFHKQMGPLISAEEMERCIHCTRCVRFGQEIGGIMELGMVHRGEHSEITTFVGQAVESELSGNMIDICPVGALTSKPFRYQARTWELARRRSVSPHDSLGANLVVQVKNDTVLRVVPYENEDVNECWISDRDRFSYEGLHSEDRLSTPLIRQADGSWQTATWPEALKAVAEGLGQVRENFGATQIGALAAPWSTTEEFALLARLMRALGSDNIDFRLRHTDANWDAARTGAPWLGMAVADVAELDRVLLVGAFPRAEQPLLTQRLRQAAKQGTQVFAIDTAADDLLLPLAGRLTVTPTALAQTLAEVLVALGGAADAGLPESLANVEPSDAAREMAASLASGERVAIWLGAQAQNSPQATVLAALGQQIAARCGGTLGFWPEGGNAVGGYVARAVPERGGKNAQAMLANPLKAYVVLHAEPALDADNGAAALAALQAAQFNVALVPYRSAAESWAHVILPVGPFTETSGTFVNLAGVAQSFKGVAPSKGESRPAWKVLRVLGNVLHLEGFDEETSEAVRDAVLGTLGERLNNQVSVALDELPQVAEFSGHTLERVADVPIYFSDPIVRRAESLQAMPVSRVPRARINAATASRLGLEAGRRVKLSHTDADGHAELELELDVTVPDGAIRVAAAHPATLALGSAFDVLTVEQL